MRTDRRFFELRQSPALFCLVETKSPRDDRISGLGNKSKGAVWSKEPRARLLFISALLAAWTAYLPKRWADVRGIGPFDLRQYWGGRGLQHWKLLMDSSPSELRRRLLELHPDLDRMSGHALGAIIREGHLRSVKAGQVVFEERTRCDGFPILLQGAVRVSKLAANGREILLYRIVPGEACVLTTGCLLGSAPYHGRGVAEEDLEVLVVPPALFSGLVEKEPVFRTYIFALFSERMAELMELVEAVAFQRLDRRLASLLLGKGGVIRTTHQHLAEELGSVREIVSRLLREFADQGLVALRREHIDILDARRLRLIAQS